MERTAKQFLIRARNLDRNISVLLKQKETLYDDLTRVTTNYDADITSGTRDPHKYDKLVELIDQLDEMTDEYADVKNEIIRTIMQVEDANQRNVLTLYYTVKDSKTKKPLTWEQVAVEMDYSWKQTRRFHAKGLAAVDRILANK